MPNNPQAGYVKRAMKKATDTQEMINRDHPEVSLTTEERHKVASFLRYQLKRQLPVEIAGQIHDGWTASKAVSGYVYGPVRNDDPQKGPLTHPLMKPADLLTSEELGWDTATVIATMAQLILILESD